MHDNDGKAVNIVAPEGGLTKNQFYYDPVTGFAGSVLDTVDEGQGVALEIVRAHRYNVAASLNVAVGDILHVGADGTLVKTAPTPARPYMKVTEVVENVTTTEDQVIGVLLPQTWAKFATS